MERLALLILLVTSACGPAPGYNAEGQFMGDPNAGLASPRRQYDPGPQPQQSSGGQSAPQPQQAQPQQQSDGTFRDQLESSMPPAQATCDDSCRFANNGECDDGRSGSDTDVCAPGTDCTDCGR